MSASAIGLPPIASRWQLVHIRRLYRIWKCASVCVRSPILCAGPSRAVHDDRHVVFRFPCGDHSACQSLRLGESSLALAGGVNLICAPETTIALSKGHMLAARRALQDLRRRRQMASRAGRDAGSSS